MAVRSGMFNSVRDAAGNGDRKYEASFFASYFSSFIGNGVFPNPSNGMQVLESTNLTTRVSAGKGWINGYYIINDSDFSIQHDVADGVLNRIDRIVMRLNFVNRSIEIALLKGSFSANPIAPTLTRNDDTYELSLADVLIGRGTTQILQSDITDNRLNSNLCGIVSGIVQQVDTTTIFNQYNSWFIQQTSIAETEMANFQAESKANFDAWFATLQEILDGDVAANLASRIASLEIRLDNHLSQDSSVKHKADQISVVAPNGINASNSQQYLDALFTGYSSRLEDMVDALLLINPNLPLNTNSTMQDVLNVLQSGEVGSGKKFATGNLVSTNRIGSFINHDSNGVGSPYVDFDFSMLDFEPSRIEFLINENSSFLTIGGIWHKDNFLYANANRYANSYSYNIDFNTAFRVPYSNSVVKIPVYVASRTYTFFAYE